MTVVIAGSGHCPFTMQGKKDGIGKIISIYHYVYFTQNLKYVLYISLISQSEIFQSILGWHNAGPEQAVSGWSGANILIKLLLNCMLINEIQ